VNYLNLGGTHRARPVAETLQLAEKFGKEIGITRVANITGLDCVGISVVVAIRPNAKLLSVSQGKGMTLDHAKVSALMESIESWHAENIPLPSLRGTYQALSSSMNLCDPCSIAQSDFDVSVLQSMPLYWCEGINIVNHSAIKIPYEALSLDSTTLSPQSLLFDTSSNGLASGNTYAEAVCHALCELIERDASHKFVRLSDEIQQKRLVDIKSINSPLANTLLGQLYSAGIKVQIWNMTSEMECPVFHCTLFDRDISRKTQIFSGEGCHIDKEVALCRAITEAAQTRLTFIAGSRDDVFPAYYEKEILTEDDTPYSGDAQYPLISAPHYQKSFEENVKIIVEALVAKGYEKVICVDHTRSHTGIHVVQMIVPGLHGKEKG